MTTHSPEGPRSARREATRSRLIEAAVGVIARKGVLGASVEEICEAAGFTRGAFYSNFESKDALCIALLDAQCQRHLAAAREAVARMDHDHELERRINDALEVFVAVSGQGADDVLVTSELRLYAAREPALREAFTAYQARITPLFATLIEDGLAAAGLRLTVGIDEALSLLHAVHDQTSLDQLVAGAEPGSGRTAQLLGQVLRAFITPA
ncbi:TetR/AcrR family transcriptional regulator [Luteococcus sediminum]